MSEYNSSEELQRHSADVFAREQVKKTEDTITERGRLKKILDKHIAQHEKTASVRKLAKSAGRTNDYQMDLSADLVEILEKIKSELR